MRQPLPPIVLTIAAGGLAAGLGVLRLGTVSLSTAALVLGAAFVAELVEEADRDRSREPVETERLRLVSAVLVTAILLLGPWVAALVAAVAVVAGAAFRPARWRLALFRGGALAVAAAAAGSAFLLAGGEVGRLTLLDDLIPLLTLGVVYLTVRALLIDVVWARESFEPRIAASGGEVALGAAAALLALAHPWDVVVLLPLGLALHQSQTRLTRLQRETLRALETFANIVDERDPSTYRHSIRVAGYVDSLARALGLPFSEIDRLRWAGRLHDLGKVAVDSTVLRKPGRLDRDEWASVRRHPRLSARLLQRFEFVATQARAVELHHERVDGHGYYGVRDEDLPLAAHFLTVADSFDAMTTDRPYRRGLSKEEALAEIERNLGTQFHPIVGKAFVAVQRGIAPRQVLSPEELHQIRGAAVSYDLGVLPGGGDLRERPELLALGGIVLALAGLGFGESWITLCGAALAGIGLALRMLVRLRSERLVRSLRRALHEAAQDSVFDELVDIVARPWPVTWAALVAWDDDGLGGRIERERGAGPETTAVTSWLVREAESGADLILAPAGELGRNAVQIALPLRRETSALAGFLVFEGSRIPARHVELALLETLDEAGLALAPAPAEPAQPLLQAL